MVEYVGRSAVNAGRIVIGDWMGEQLHVQSGEACIVDPLARSGYSQFLVRKVVARMFLDLQIDQDL
jgi:hypothetical protein